MNDYRKASLSVYHFTIWREQVSIKHSDAEHILFQAFDYEIHLRRNELNGTDYY